MKKISKNRKMCQLIPFTTTTLCSSSIFVILLILQIGGSNGSSHERKLLSHLLENYNKLERPVYNHSHSVHVKFGLSLLTVNKVDEKGATIDTTFWLTLKWHDANLEWNPVEFDNITDVRIPINLIWQPDIHVSNSQRETVDTTYYETMVVVKHDGSTIYAPPGVHKTSCPMNFSLYPFDEQKCEIKFGSWTYDSGQLNLHLINENGEGDISSYVNNSEWNLKGLDGHRNALYFGHKCCDPYVKVIFTVHIQRKGDFLLCCAHIINAFICFLILMSFVLSPGSGQKLILGIGILVCNIWTLAYIYSVLPFEHNSKLCKYFECLCGLVFSSIIANIYTIFLHYRIHPMSELVRKIFVDGIPRCLFCCCPRRNRYSVSTVEIVERPISSSNNISTDGKVDPSRFPSDKDYQDLLSEIERKISIQEENMKCINDWQYLASIVDRCFLVIYSVFIALFIALLFPSFKNTTGDSDD